jgi:hypothetical protein
MNVIFRFSIKHQLLITYFYFNMYKKVSKFCVLYHWKLKYRLLYIVILRNGSCHILVRLTKYGYFRLTKIVSMSIVKILSPGEQVYYINSKAYVCK